MSIFSFTIVNMSIETPDGVLDVTNATLRVPQIEVQGTSVTTSLSTLSNVGVGTTTPGGRLHVYGPDAKTLLQSTSNTANVEIGGPSGAIVDLKGPFTDDYDLRIQSSSDGGNLATTGNVNHIRLASTSGYTGFGTATPQYKIDVQGVKGIDAVSNPSAHNPVFLYDDQESTTTFSGTVGGTGASRNTTSKYIELNSLADNVTGYAYWPIQMPNSWSAEFDHFIGGGDGGESLSFSFFNTSAPTSTGNHGGYRLAIAEFYGGAPAAKVVLYYQGSEVAQKNIVGGIPSSSWNKVVVNYNRGSISLSLNGRSVFSYEATENADSYTGRYVGFIGKTGLRDNFHRVRNVKCTSGTNWVYATGSNATTLAYLSGNVGIGTDVTTERLEISGNVKATHFVGDGGLLSNIATTLNAIVNQGNTTSNTVQFTNADTGIVSTGNIVVEEGSFFVGDGSKLVNIPTDFESIIVNGNTTSNVVYFANTDVAIQASGNVVVDSDSFFIGNGGLLSNIATTLEDISNQGNTTSNTIQFTNSDVGFVTTANVGISNSAPTKNLSVGSNLHVDDTGSNVLTVHGNVAANAVTIGAFQVVASYGLNQVTAENNTTSENIILTNAKTGLTVSSNIDVAGQLNLSNATTCIDASSNIELGGRLRFDSNVFVDTLRVADLAANLVTYEQSTGELLDSGGLFLNKIAVVSEQPAGVLTANSTTVTNHGTYKLTTSNLASGSNTWNAFDGSSAVAWTGSSSYTGASNAYAGSVQLASSTGVGEWLAIEFPYKTTLRHMKLTPVAVASYPGTANLYATNDSITWTLLKQWSSVTPSSVSEVQTVKVDASDAYKRYAIVATKAAGDSAEVAIARWQLFAESFAIDGGKVAMASSAITGGNTVVDQTGPHGRGTVPLRKYPEVLLTSDVQGGYVASASGTHTNGNHPAFKAFDGDNSDWQIDGGRYSDSGGGVYTHNAGETTVTNVQSRVGDWVQLESPRKIRVKTMKFTPVATYGQERSPATGVLVGSNDNGSTWTEIKLFDVTTDGTPTSYTAGSSTTLAIDSGSNSSPGYYKIHRLIWLTLYTASQSTYADRADVRELEYYGYEETSDPDTSVDTTITSQFNLPDTTGVKLYIDGDKGSTATDFSGEGHTLTENNATYDSTEKAWEFSSLSTSNVTMTSGDLAMEGTHPHSVSLWFNAANVSSNATLFYVGTAAGEGDAKTAISLTETGHLGWIDGGDNQFLSANTWHNLVYATQGGGGVRTCYLDGRKLGDVSVQDTFGDYPPFAMSTYSDRGYTASASTEFSGYEAWKAFEDATGNSTNYWSSSTALYNSSSPYNFTSSGDPYETTVGGTLYRGDWIQMEMPNKIKLDYVTIFPRLTNRFPRQGVFAGSNDGENWDLIHAFSGLSVATETDTAIVTNSENNKKAYKYIRLVITHLNGGTYSAADNIKFFGHKENDTTRFPISSTVLKYPHIAMTGPAQRGYVASASREPTTYAAPAWGAFDGGTTSTWETVGGAYDQTTGLWNSSVTVSTTVDGTGENGDWVQIELPRKSIVTKMRYQPTLAIRAPANGILAASNDGTTWTALYNISNATYTNDVFVDFAISNTTAYKYYRLIATSLYTDNVYNSSRNRFATRELELYGTEEDLDIVARVGEGLDGKVANFRVYDKYLHEEQALELWDAQKDQFGVATSSVTVYRGHVGIGTTTPSAALTIMDDAHESEEFPPRAMTDHETYMEGHGVFKASSSPVYTSDYSAYKAFDKVIPYNTSENQWVAEGNTYDGASPNSFPVTSGDKAVLFEGTYGSWIQLSLPYKILLKRMVSFIRVNRDYEHATSGIVYGSNDDETYDVIYTFDDVPVSDQLYQGVHHEINATKAYSTYTFQITKLEGVRTFTILGELKFFGTRERGQSTLHDGELKLTKNLTVPRIGPALNGGWASQTPRRDHLVVEYDTSTDLHNSKAMDSSGNEIHGTFSGAYYNRGEGAFTFDGSDDYVSGTLNNPSGPWVHSVSCWWKTSVDPGTSGYDTIFSLGDFTAAEFTTFYIKSNIILLSIYASGAFFPFSVQVNRWYHTTVVMRGPTSSISDIDFYLDGVRLTASSQSGTATIRNLPANASFRLGREVGTGTNYLKGSISNFKIYDGALGPGEVRKLYEMGRNGPGNYMHIVDTAVAIGRHAPQAQLDVSGKIRAQGSNTNFTGQHRCSSAQGPLEKGLVVSASKNTYRNITGGLSTGPKAITIDESLPVVSLSNVAQDKACFGVVSRMEEANTLTRSETVGGLISEDSKVLGDNRVIVNSVGEGAIWVCDANGPLESGDYITTSNIAGYGQKQESDSLKNYTVAKITMDCDFEPATQPVQQILRSNVVETHYTGMVPVVKGVPHEFVTTTVTADDEWSNVSVSPSDVTYAEWSNLEANVQNTYTLTYTQTSNVVYDVKYTKTTTANVTAEDAWDAVHIEPSTVTYAEYSNLEANVQNTYSLTYTMTTKVEATEAIYSNLSTEDKEFFVLTYYHMAEQRVNAEYPGAVKHEIVTDIPENALDEHGQLQWEDDPSGATEKAYKIRYLDASGQITDEANAVHTAAFVGVTYHCG
jgi:hypothetical protein